MEKELEGVGAIVIEWTISLSNNNIFQTFDTKKTGGQAVDFHSPVFVQEKTDVRCRVSKQYARKIHFARSENDDVIK